MTALSNGHAASSFNIPTIKFTKLFINGQFVDSLSGKEFETIDPRTEEVIARIAEGRKEDIDVAVKAARVAFDNGPWPRMPGALPYMTQEIEENYSGTQHFFFKGDTDWTKGIVDTIWNQLKISYRNWKEERDENA